MAALNVSEAFTALNLKHGTIKKASIALGISDSDIHNYLRGRKVKVSKKAQRIIRQHLVEIGVVAAPQLKPRHECPDCGKSHVVRVNHPSQSTKSIEAGQRQTVAEISASKIRAGE
jgi:predicted RNA-binding Zn-ribbon protein involved in translation (DUF1610 family)